MHSCHPAEQLPRAERGRPRGVPGEPSGHKHKRMPLLGVKHDLTRLAGSQNPGSWRAQGSRPASQAHLHSPRPPCWALGLLPPPTHSQGHPFPEPLEAATRHITSLLPGLHHLWALSLPPTPGHVLMGNLPSGVDGWLGDRALPSLWAPTCFPLQWLWSCFHCNRA